VIEPVTAPTCVGENTTLIVHFCPMGSAVPQLLVSVKDPDALILLMFKGA
jgi:hypothetical protein